MTRHPIDRAAIQQRIAAEELDRQRRQAAELARQLNMAAEGTVTGLPREEPLETLKRRSR